MVISLFFGKEILFFKQKKSSGYREKCFDPIAGQKIIKKWKSARCVNLQFFAGVIRIFLQI